MALLGSFALVLALALSVYCLAAGVVAVVRHGPNYERLGETARRAGIAVWACVAVAAAVLVTATFVLTALVAALVARHRLHTRPHLLATLAREFERDAAALDGDVP